MRHAASCATSAAENARVAAMRKGSVRMRNGMPLAGRGSGRAYLHPAPIPRRFQHGVGDVVRLQRFAEGGRCALTIGQGREKVGSLMNEGMLVADLQSRHPPVLHVGMVAIRDVDAAPSADASLVLVIEIL